MMTEMTQRIEEIIQEICKEEGLDYDEETSFLELVNKYSRNDSTEMTKDFWDFQRQVIATKPKAYKAFQGFLRKIDDEEEQKSK